MKLFIFKINNNLDIQDYPAISENSLIYAWTNNKDYADTFRRNRNMEIFTEEIYSTKDKGFEKLLKRLTSEFQDAELGINDLKYKDIIDGRVSILTISIITTTKESDEVKFSPNQYFEEYLDNLRRNTALCRAINNRIFKPKILEALNMNFYADIILNEIVNPFDDINLESYDFDELGLYVRLFSNTYKRKELG